MVDPFPLRSHPDAAAVALNDLLARSQADAGSVKPVFLEPPAFGTEIALLRTSEGGMSRMGVSWDTPGYGGEIGRVRGQRLSMTGMNYQGLEQQLPDLTRPALPPTVDPGGHGGSHGYLGHEFVMSILEDRQPLVDIAMALNLTVSGIVAHQSALKDGEWLKIPQYRS